LRKSGFQEVKIEGEGEVAEICRLTCLEQNIHILETGNKIPVFRINELKIYVEFMEDQTE
jgi:hypothetical protein